jgi:hypothetical protein
MFLKSSSSSPTPCVSFNPGDMGSQGATMAFQALSNQGSSIGYLTPHFIKIYKRKRQSAPSMTPQCSNRSKTGSTELIHVMIHLSSVAIVPVP